MYHFFFFFEGSNLRFNSRVFSWLYVKQSFFPGCIGFKKFGYPYSCMVYGYKMEQPNINKQINQEFALPAIFEILFLFDTGQVSYFGFYSDLFYSHIFQIPKDLQLSGLFRGGVGGGGGENMEFPEGYKRNDMKNLQGLIKNWNFQG